MMHMLVRMLLRMVMGVMVEVNAPQGAPGAYAWQGACKRYRLEDDPRRGAKRFGDIVTFDLISPHRGKKDQEIAAADGSHTAILFYDLATGWLQIVLLAHHDKDAIVRAIRFFA